MLYFTIAYLFVYDISSLLGVNVKSNVVVECHFHYFQRMLSADAFIASFTQVYRSKFGVNKIVAAVAAYFFNQLLLFNLFFAKTFRGW